MQFKSSVEQSFFEQSSRKPPTTTVPYILVNNFPRLGFFTALRFLEWVHDHPEGVISLPTGKTPEYFIKWVDYLLSEWFDKKLSKLRQANGLTIDKKPDLRGLHFVQIDEFYPIDPRQYNSFFSYVNKFYIRQFGLDPARALLINCDEIPRRENLPLSSIFPDNRVDLSLRYRTPGTEREELQRDTIFMVDQWCSDYEEQVREKGGIGFFLGGIGPDGHIAFNVRGSDHNSTTRLTETNFETQAAAASDLGGIEISRNRLVITIGLDTITSDPEGVAIIFAAGEAKARIIKESLESQNDVRYPGTALQSMSNSSFYLTTGAACQLSDSIDRTYSDESWDDHNNQRAVIQLCHRANKFGTKLTYENLKQDPLCARIPDLDEQTLPKVLDTIRNKIKRGITKKEDQVFYHTGPHHDDIMLGFLPHIMHLVRSASNDHYFANMTSGFTSVTNDYIINVLEKTRELLNTGQIQMTEYPDFFDTGYKKKWDKDVYHYLDRIAANNIPGQERGLSHRVVRCLVDIYGLKNRRELEERINQNIDYLSQCYDGEKNTPDIQKLKGMIREFEEELVWAHFGVQVKNVNHYRLGFYTGDIFTEQPDRSRDVKPILNSLKKIKPTVISLALDPEGSGPDTHYKVLQAIAEAVRLWGKNEDLSHLRIWGYRNVWYRFDPAEADIIVPVSLNSMAVLRDTFMSCYLSQKNASFPSYELDGPFCDLDQRIWVDQHQELELVLGRDFWYQNPDPRCRAAHGALYLREMSVDEFLQEAQRLAKSMEGQIGG